MKIKLNLIPEYKKEEIQLRNIFFKIIRWGIQFLVVYLFFILILFSLSHILKLHLQANILQLSPNNIARFDEFKEHDKKIRQTNTQVQEVKKIQNGQLNWTKLFLKLGDKVTEGIKINQLITKDYSVFLAGSSNNRDNLNSFKQELSSDDCFSDVDLPLDYLATKENLEFKMTFIFKKECLK